jgi:hypothetical protein
VLSFNYARSVVEATLAALIDLCLRDRRPTEVAAAAHARRVDRGDPVITSGNPEPSVP